MPQGWVWPAGSRHEQAVVVLVIKQYTCSWYDARTYRVTVNNSTHVDDYSTIRQVHNHARAHDPPPPDTTCVGLFQGHARYGMGPSRPPQAFFGDLAEGRFEKRPPFVYRGTGMGREVGKLFGERDVMRVNDFLVGRDGTG